MTQLEKAELRLKCIEFVLKLKSEGCFEPGLTLEQKVDKVYNLIIKI